MAWVFSDEPKIAVGQCADVSWQLSVGVPEIRMCLMRHGQSRDVDGLAGLRIRAQFRGAHVELARRKVAIDLLVPQPRAKFGKPNMELAQLCFGELLDGCLKFPDF